MSRRKRKVFTIVELGEFVQKTQEEYMKTNIRKGTKDGYLAHALIDFIAQQGCDVLIEVPKLPKKARD